jgi:N-acetylglutamate synthase-like GNAT family acetyltransferase
MIIRQAKAEDAGAVERLYHILQPEKEHLKVSADRVEELGDDPASFLFVVEDEGRVVGTAHVHFCLDVFVDRRPFAIIERVVIDPEYRSRGCGSELIRHIEVFCSGKNCAKMILTTRAGRPQAHEFYRRLGFDGESDLAFKKYLG